MKYRIAWYLLYEDKQHLGFLKDYVEMDGIDHNIELLAQISTEILGDLQDAIENKKFEPTKFGHTNLLCLSFKKSGTMGMDFWEFIIPIQIKDNKFVYDLPLAAPLKDMIEYWIYVKAKVLKDEING